MNNLFGIEMSDIKNIYSSLLDEESKDIFINRLLYSITGEYKYILNIIKPEEIHYKLKAFEKVGKRLIIFGAGLMGKIIFEKILKDIKWECFVDNNIKEKTILGLNVIDFNELKEKYFDEVILISPLNESNDIYNQLISAGFNKENIVNFGEYIKGYKEKMLPKQYFEFISKSEEESFVDAGCFDGYTSKKFIEYCNENYSNIWAFEPELTDYKICKKELNFPNCTVYNLGLYDEDGTISFKAGLSQGSAIDIEGETTINIAKLDNILKDEKITFIKMDIEGAELKALYGAQHIIENQKPKLAICVYHKIEDIVTIPSLLLKFNKDYKFILRHYSSDCTETVLYAFNQKEEIK